MQAAVKGALLFSNFQLVPGLVELHGEPDDWPACKFSSWLGEFYLVYWPRKCYS